MAVSALRRTEPGLQTCPFFSTSPGRTASIDEGCHKHGKKIDEPLCTHIPRNNRTTSIAAMPPAKAVPANCRRYYHRLHGMVLASFAIPAVFRTVRARNPELPSAGTAFWPPGRRKITTAFSPCARRVSEHRPLDPFRLVLRGFASFYPGVGETDGEIRIRYMDDAVFLPSEGPDFLFRTVHGPRYLYVLGKAYYQKGPYYMDEAVTVPGGSELRRVCRNGHVGIRGSGVFISGRVRRKA